MSKHSHAHSLNRKRLVQRPGPIPEPRLPEFLHVRDMSLIVRSPDSTTSSSDSATTSCGPNDTTGVCERMVAASPNTTTIPVVLGVVLPLTMAFVILVVLHRRHVKKLRQEDAEDKHKSLDFGLDGSVAREKKTTKKGPSKIPEMTAADARRTIQRDRGMSMDLTMGNPYILPPELHNSRESLHSLSRSLHTDDDKYRATNFIPDDGSLRSPSSLRHRDDASIYTYSSRHRTDTDSTKGLLHNGHVQINEPVPIIQVPNPAMKDANSTLLPPTVSDAHRESFQSTTSSNGGNLAAMRASNNYLGQYISGGAQKKALEQSGVQVTVSELDGNTSPNDLRQPPVAALKDGPSKRNSVLPAAAGFDFEIPPNTYELSSNDEPTLPRFDITPAEQTIPEIHEAPGHEVVTRQHPQRIQSNTAENVQDSIDTHDQKKQQNHLEVKGNSQYEDESDYYDDEADDYCDLEEYKDVLGYDPRRLTMGMRPLPPDDPTENPEERAIRIRSFYKEYFDETAKPGGEKTRLSYFDGSENYIDDYYGSQHQPAYGHGSHAPASYDHRAYGYNPGYGSRVPSAMSARGPPGRHRATVSNGSYMTGGQGPRAHSSASQRLPGQRTRFAPKKKLPPPTPLQVLPTPSMLKEDSMLPNAIDYAPPQMFKNQRSGTPDNLRGGLRPYSPSARAYNPLVSSFDDLSALPSPHQLRRSGLFTSLDFAPPRLAAAASGTGSETGSIRSNRSGTSAMQLHNIRSGAYRLSRIPKEVAGTKQELAQALRPQWNAR